MSSLLVRPSARVRQADGKRRRLGVDAVFSGRTLRVTTERATESQAGTNALPLKQHTIFAPSASPRLFIFCPTDFAPYTTHQPPREGQTLRWHDIEYQITQIDYEDVGEDTISILVYAFRKVL